MKLNFDLVLRRARPTLALLVCLFGSSLASGQSIQTIAGGGVGDGPNATSASVSFAGELAVDTSGNLYVADWGNHRVRKVSPSGATSTVAGTGLSGSLGDGGPAVQASLNKPYGLAIDSVGNLYIAEQVGNRIRKVAPNGTISTVAGDGTSAVLDGPQDLAVAPDGTIYVSVSNSHRVLKIVDGVVSNFAGNGTAGYSGDAASATSAQLNAPSGLLVEPGGSVLIADLLNDRVRRVDTSGTISTFKTLQGPYDLAYNAAGELHVTTYCMVLKLSAAGASTRLIGDDTCPIGFGGDGGWQDVATFNNITAIAIAADGRIFLNDRYNQRVRVASGGLINTFVGPGAEGNGGPALGARLSQPAGMAYDAAGNLYVSERYINKIRKITPAGVISTFAGTGAAGFSGDGGPAAAASFFEPRGLAIDLAGNLLVADHRNSRIRSISPGGTISTIAGGGTSGDGGPATSASVFNPDQILVDATGDIYISQTGRVRRIHDGMISTFAGGGTVFADNMPATSVKLSRPAQMGFDGAGNFFFADTTNHTVRRIDPAGTIVTVAGSHGISGSSGDGSIATAALLAAPHGLAVYQNGDFIVSSGARLRKVTAGSIATVAGSGIAGYNGDGAALSSLIEPVSAVGHNAVGEIVFLDAFNNRARKLHDGAGSQPSLSISDASVGEGNAGSKSLDFTLTLSAASASTVSLSTATSNGSASAGSDYVALALSDQTIAAGQTSKIVSVTINGDSTVEPDETFALNISNVVGATVSDSSAVGTIVNDDAGSGPTLSIADVSIIEGNISTKTATFTVVLSAAQANPVFFDIATANGTASAGTDYVAKSTLGLRIPIGATSRTFVITVNGDATSEADETFFVRLSNPDGATVVDGEATGTISNDDAAFAPALSITDASAAEGNSGTQILSFTVSLSGATTVPVTFELATANHGSAGAGDDYLGFSQLGGEIAVGATSKTFDVTINSDTTYEPSETFAVNMSNAVGATIVDGSGTGTIVNDDPAPSLTIADVSVAESDDNSHSANFWIAFSKRSEYPISFDLTTSDVSATAGSDYQSVTTHVNVPPNTDGHTALVMVYGDTNTEQDETFTVTVSNVVGATVIDGLGTGTIINDDAGGGITPTLSIGDVSILEGNSGSSFASFTVSLSEPAATAVTFNANTFDGSATSASDYIAQNWGNVQIPAGFTSTTLSVPVTGDSTHEPDESFSLTVSSIAGASAGDVQAIGTIINDDTPASGIALSIADVSISEGNSATKTLTFTVVASAASASPILFDIATANGTATAGTDYVAKSTLGLRIPIGSTSRTFAVTINGDTTGEPDESFVVNVSNVTGATIADSQAIGTITNDDTAATPTLSIADLSIVEGNAGTKVATFTVSLSPAAAGTVTYNIATANGTATAGSDYVASVLSGQPIAAGVTSKTFAVTINGDTTTEPNETFTVALSSVVGATLGDGNATGTITNDEASGGTPTLSIGDVTIAEGNSLSKQATFTLTLSSATNGPVTYNIATANGTALSGTDYVAKALTAQSIPAGTLSKIFNVGIRGDLVVEPNETFVVNVSGVAGATLADGQATGTISNDDPTAVRIARFDAAGLFDDLDDGNREPLVSPEEFASLLLDTATRLCSRTGRATIIAVDSVENARVLAELADTVNATCAAEPRYEAVMGPQHTVGFLVESTAANDARGAQVLESPLLDVASGLTLLKVTASGHDAPLRLLVPQALPNAVAARNKQLRGIAQKVRSELAGESDARLVLIGELTVPGLLDLTSKSALAKPSLPAERVLVSPAVLREYATSRVEFSSTPANKTPAQVLQLQR